MVFSTDWQRFPIRCTCQLIVAASELSLLTPGCLPASTDKRGKSFLSHLLRALVALSCKCIIKSIAREQD